MFRKKKTLYTVALTPAEKKLMVQAMLRFRNKLLAMNKPTGDVNAILLRLLKN